MEAPTIPNRPDVVSVTSEPRPTPPPPQRRFNEVLVRGAGTVVQGAELAMTQLPGVPLVAAAVRGGPSPLVGTGAVSPAPGSGAGVSPMLTAPLLGGTGVGMATPGPLLTGAATGSTSPTGPMPLGGAGDVPSGGLESTIAQSEEMNLYFLQVQEQVNAENRSYTALSNVLKTEHDTVKNAIGNIR